MVLCFVQELHFVSFPWSDDPVVWQELIGDLLVSQSTYILT